MYDCNAELVNHIRVIIYDQGRRFPKNIRLFEKEASRRVTHEILCYARNFGLIINFKNCKNEVAVSNLKTEIITKIDNLVRLGELHCGSTKQFFVEKVIIEVFRLLNENGAIVGWVKPHESCPNDKRVVQFTPARAR